jgi:hypothetical protein
VPVWPPRKQRGIGQLSEICGQRLVVTEARVVTCP